MRAMKFSKTFARGGVRRTTLPDARDPRNTTTALRSSTSTAPTTASTTTIASLTASTMPTATTTTLAATTLTTEPKPEPIAHTAAAQTAAAQAVAPAPAASAPSYSSSSGFPSSIVGNIALWKQLCGFVSERAVLPRERTHRRPQQKRPRVCFVVGPGGIGKTRNPQLLARHCGRRVQYVHCAELECSEQNQTSLTAIISRDATTRPLVDARTDADGADRTKTSSRTTSHHLAPVLILDDAHTTPEPLRAQLRALLEAPPAAIGPVIVVCGTHGGSHSSGVPSWLRLDKHSGRADHDRRKHNTLQQQQQQQHQQPQATNLHLRPLSLAELRTIARIELEPHRENGQEGAHGLDADAMRLLLNDDAEACKRAFLESRGDARAFMLALRSQSLSRQSQAASASASSCSRAAGTIDGDAPPHQRDEWAAATHLLHGAVTPTSLEHTLRTAERPDFLARLLHTNYMAAVATGVRTPFGDDGRTVLQTLAGRAAMASDAQVLRDAVWSSASGPTAAAALERSGMQLLARLSCGLSATRSAQPNVRLQAPQWTAPQWTAAKQDHNSGGVWAPRALGKAIPA